MKKIVILILLGVLVFTPEFTQATESKVDKTEINQKKGKGRRNKNGSYRKKKGFMWGIFKGKNQCDCPKH